MNDIRITRMLANELCATLQPIVGGNGTLEKYAADLAESFANFADSKGWPLESILKNNVRQDNLASLFSMSHEFETARAKHGMKSHPISDPLSNAIDSARISKYGSQGLAEAKVWLTKNDLMLDARNALARTMRNRGPQPERVQLEQKKYTC